MFRLPACILGVLVSLSAFGCAPYYAFPQAVRDTVDPTLTFAQVKEAPNSHRGKIIMVGGEVLLAKRLKDHTRLTILQLPLGDSQDPLIDRTKSQGRFFAIHEDFLDPATVPSGTRVTLIGEVSGVTMEMLDEMEYPYPTITIKNLKIWPAVVQQPYWPPPYYWYGPYWYGPYYGSPFWRYGRFGPYSPYWPYWW